MKKLITTILGLLIGLHVIIGCSSSISGETSNSNNTEYETERFNKQDREKAIRLISSGKWDQALTFLIDYTNKNPKNGESWFYLASAYHGKQDYKNAIDANQKAVELSHQMRASAYYNLACAYSLTNDLDNASEALKLAQQSGFLDYDLLRTDKDIELLRENDFIELPQTYEYDRIVHNGIEIKYHIILPENYNKSKTYPAMLAYPPGSQGKTSADWALSEFWGTAAGTKDWIIVVPVAPKNGWINHPSHHALNDLLKTVKRNYEIEDGKFHMVGFESGARPAATFALMSKQYFQSLTIISSYALERWDDEDLRSFNIMPVKMIVGGDDEHGLAAAHRVEGLFKQFEVEYDLEIIPNEARHLPSLRNAALIEKIEDFVR